jgi:uncharacterized protein (TIGR02145 family)
MLLRIFLLLLPFVSFHQGIYSSNRFKHTSSCVLYALINQADTVSFGDPAHDTLQKIVRFDHSVNGSNYFYVRFSRLRSEIEQQYFFKGAIHRGIYIVDRNDAMRDSALFVTSLTINRAWQEFREIYQLAAEADSVAGISIRSDLGRSSSTTAIQALQQPGMPLMPLETSTECSSAQVACSGNIYSFPAGTVGEAPPAFNGYPNYGCLWQTPGPAWFFMQIGVAGDIIFHIAKTGGPTFNDVDFICWGPFTSLTEGCATGLTGNCIFPCCSNTSPTCIYPSGNITDCSFDLASEEDCHILNAQVGEIYILLITNFSKQVGTITFSQTGGTGLTNCNIVSECSMIAITTNQTTCNEPAGTFSVSGNIEFSNPSPTGTLTITDITAVPPVSQTFTPPFVSPLAYNLQNIPCDGLVHSLTAVFSDSTDCTLTNQFTAPGTTCPHALISGGGTICNNGSQQASIAVTFTVGAPPYTFVYAIDGINQPPVTHNSTAPYTISAMIPGAYTLVSVANQSCPSGMVSGSATVIVNPLPTATISGTATVCQGAASPDIAFTGGSATPPYTFTYNINGGSSHTVTSSGNSATIQVPTDVSGTFSYNLVSVQDASSTMCSQLQTGTATVTVNPLPTATIAGTTTTCLDSPAPMITFAGGGATPPYTFIYNLNGGTSQTVTTTSGNSIAVQAPTNVAGIFTYTLVSVEVAGATTCTQLQTGSAAVTVNPLPVPAITGPAAICANTSGIYSTAGGMTGYGWTVSPGGTITGGGSTDSITVVWSTPGATTITVNYTDGNGCTAHTAAIYPVTVSTLPVPTISGINSICSGTQTTYTTEPAMQSYNWTVSSDGTISGGGQSTDPAVTVNWTTPGPNSVSVNYTNGGGCTAQNPTQYNVSVNPAAIPTITSPANTVCASSSTTYTTQPGMSGYSWTVSPGGSIVSGSSSNMLAVQWNNPGAQHVTVSYTNNFNCTAATPANYDLFVSPLPVTTITEAPVPVCQSLPHFYEVPANPACSFTWSVIPAANGVIASGQGTHVVTIDWQTSGGAVVAVTGTGTSTNCVSSSTLPVVVMPKPLPVFTPCFDLVTTTDAKKIILRGGAPFLPAQGVYSGPRISLNTVTGNWEFDPFGAPAGDYHVTYTFTNTFGCPASAGPATITVQNRNFSCGGDLTDVRDGKKYQTALLSGRCWMADNLAYGTTLDSPGPLQTDNCLAEKYCSPADAGCNKYGGMYQWDELMDYAVTPGTKGICPPGWHVPTVLEWQSLIDNLIAGTGAPHANAVAGSTLKDLLLTSGFQALMGGIDYNDNAWAFISGSLTGTLYWTSTATSATHAAARGLNNYNASISLYSSSRGNAFSLRCVKD